LNVTEMILSLSIGIVSAILAGALVDIAEYQMRKKAKEDDRFAEKVSTEVKKDLKEVLSECQKDNEIAIKLQEEREEKKNG